MRLGPCWLRGVLDGVKFPEAFRGDLYEKRFLLGVDGVMLAGGSDDAALREGGVWEWPDSCREPEKPGSGVSEWMSGWGTESPKNSFRRTLEYVRFASSAVVAVSQRSSPGEKIKRLSVTYFSGNGYPHSEASSCPSRELSDSRPHVASCS